MQGESHRDILAHYAISCFDLHNLVSIFLCKSPLFELRKPVVKLDLAST